MQRDWSTGLFQCCVDRGVCCRTTFCPCLVYGEVVGALPRGSMCCAGNPQGAAVGYCALFFLECFFHALDGEPGAGACAPYLIGRSRALLRERFGIRRPTGFFDGDCFVACCCSSCALCQERRELERRPPVMQAHQPVGPMLRL